MAIAPVLSLKDIKVLVVDESPTVRAMLTDVLEDDGYRVRACSDGVAALQILTNWPADLILSAVAMPDMNGLELLRRLKSTDETRQIPVIIATADERNQTLKTAFEYGATDYISKPVSEVALRARVRHALTNSLQKRELAASREAAIEATRSKSAFLANMSHEIRTPMTAILGFSEILVENDLPKDCVEAAETIKRNGEYLLELINDILDLSKIEAGRLDVEKQIISPVAIVEDVLLLMRVRAEAKGLELIARCEGPIPPLIESDPTRLRQILINLIGNAVKFTEVGTVEIVTSLENDSASPQLRFDIIDSGIGMTEVQQRRLFQPFSQADASTTRRFGGTGLGLCICKRLAGALGGDISAKSVRGVGSIFTARIAAGDLEAIAAANDRPSATDAPVAGDSRAPVGNAPVPCRVLLAEDGPDNQRLLTFILRKAGAEVTVAEDGRAAVEAVCGAENDCVSNSPPFDLILMDMQMPVMDGYEATHRLRELGHTGPIIALTAHASTGDREKCLDAGCDDFMSKPIQRAALVELLHVYGRQHELVTGG